MCIKSIFIFLNRRIHLEVFWINQTKKKDFSLLKLTSCSILQLFFFILFLFPCMLLLVENLDLTLRLTPSCCHFANLPISHFQVNILFKKVIYLSNLFEEYNLITFLVTQGLVPAALCDHYTNIITYFSCCFMYFSLVPKYTLMWLPLPAYVIFHRFVHSITVVFFRARDTKQHYGVLPLCNY